LIRKTHEYANVTNASQRFRYKAVARVSQQGGTK